MRRRVGSARVARLATVTHDGRPHVVPCCLAVAGDVLHTVVDDVKAKSTAALRRLDNIRRNPAVSVLVDHYEDDDWTALWWVRLDGSAEVVIAGSAEHDAGTALLRAKYEQYALAPLAGDMIVVHIERWTAWP